MSRLFSLTKYQLQRIFRQVRPLELEPKEDLPTRPLPSYHAIDHLAGVAYSTITAMSGNTPGTGQVQAKKFDSGTAADYADAPGNLVDVLNFGSAIASGSYVICHRHRESGKWICNLTSDRSVRYGIGLASLSAGASDTVAITGESLAATGGIFSISSGEAVIAPIGRYLIGAHVGFGNSAPTEDMGVSINVQQYVSGLASWAQIDVGRNNLLCSLLGANRPVTVTCVAPFETTEANQHIRVYATNHGATDSIVVENYSHLWIKALDA